MTQEILTEAKRQLLAARIMSILHSSQLSPQEILGLFRAGMPQSNEARIAGIAEQITLLLFEEQLSIAEAANVLKEVTNGLMLDDKVAAALEPRGSLI